MKIKLTRMKICTHTHTALCLTLFVILLRLAGLSIRVRCWCLLPQRTASGLHNLFVVVRRHSLVDTARQCVGVGGGGGEDGTQINREVISAKFHIQLTTQHLLCVILCVIFALTPCRETLIRHRVNRYDIPN